MVSPECFLLNLRYALSESGKVIDKKNKSKTSLRTLIGEIKGDKIYFSKFKANEKEIRDIPVEISVFKEEKGKIIIDNYEFKEVIKK